MIRTNVLRFKSAIIILLILSNFIWHKDPSSGVNQATNISIEANVAKVYLPTLFLLSKELDYIHLNYMAIFCINCSMYSSLCLHRVEAP